LKLFFLEKNISASAPYKFASSVHDGILPMSSSINDFSTLLPS